MSFKEPAKENGTQATQSNRKKGSVLRLHDVGETAKGYTASQFDNPRIFRGRSMLQHL